MSSITERTKPKRRYAMQHALAPQIDEEWAQSFVVEQRLLGVEGTRIGAAVSEVESHCVESRQSAQLAFGTPVEYARSLQPPVNQENSPRAVMRLLVPMMVQVLGMTLLNWSFEAALRGPGLEITAGRLLIPVLSLLAMVAVVRFPEPVFRTVMYHPIIAVMLAWLTFIAFIAIGVVAFSLQLPIHAGTSPRAMLLSLSPVVLLVLLVLGMWMLIRGFTAWRESGQLEITTAPLAVVVVFVLLASLVARFADPVKRSYAHPPDTRLGHRGGQWGSAGVRVLVPIPERRDLAATRRLEPGSRVGGTDRGIVLVIMRRPNSGSPDGPVTSPLDPTGKDLGYYGIPGPVLKFVSSSMFGPVMLTSGTLFLLAVIWWLTR